MKKTLYLCIKVGVSEQSPHVPVSVEGAFEDKKKAEEFFFSKSKSWQEAIGGVAFDCTRVLHEVEVELSE